MQGQKVFITGANGFVGSNLVELFKFERPDIQLYTCHSNLFDYESILTELKIIQPDCILHLAANVGGLYYNMERNVTLYEENSQINRNIYKAANILKIPKLISCMSTCIFPVYPTKFLYLDDLHNGPPHFSNIGYSYAKREIDHLNRVYSTNELIRYSLIPCNIFGPYDHFTDSGRSHVIPALISRCVESVQNEKPFVIKGSGKALRQFLYVQDFCHILIKEATKNENYLTQIIAPTTEYTIEQVARMIMYFVANAFEKPQQQLEFDASFSDGVERKYAVSRYVFDYTPFDIALKETCLWYLLSQDFMKK